MAYAQTVSGLAPATTYYFCAIAGSATKPNFGAVLALTTKAGVPTVITTPPTEVMLDSAVLNGSVVSRGESATVWFRESPINPGSCTDSFGVRAEASGGSGLGAGVAVAYSVALSGLTQGTTYYYCIIATNSQGTSFGEVLSFVPGADALSVTTEPATAVDPVSATISGTVNANVSATPVWFRYGEFDPGTCDDAFGSRAAATGDTPLDGETNTRAFTAPLAGLKPSFTYYYCAAASNQGGAKFGKVRSFTTAAEPLLLGTVSSTGAAEDPKNLGGCSYRARSGGSGSLLGLMSILSLASLLMFRRRRRPS